MKGGNLDDHKGFLPKFQPYPLGVGDQQGSPGNHFPGPPLHHPQHHAGSRETPPPDEAEVDSRAVVLSSPPQPPQSAAATPVTAKKQKKGTAAALAGGEGAGGDGATIEVVRRPRGRPPGSKNKPKPPVVITREAGDSSNVMRPHILEIPAGHDVVESLSRFSRRRDLGLSVLAATGPVSNVTLRQPQFHQGGPVSGSPPAPPANTTTITIPGRFDILSVSATFFPPSFSAASPILPSTGGSFSISLAGPHGQIVGGCVAGPLVAAGTVTVVAAAFSGPTFHRLPADDELAVSVSVSVSPAPPPSAEGTNRVPPSAGNSVDLEQGHHRPSHPHQQHLHQQQLQLQLRQLPQHHHAVGSLARDHAAPMPISSSHLLSDVIWAPTVRPPHHPSPYQ